MAKAAVYKILGSYPGTTKPPAGYVASLIDVMRTYPPEVIERLADLRHGLPARCKFLPTIADVVEFAKEWTPSPTVAYGSRDEKIVLSMEDYYAIEFMPGTPASDAAIQRFFDARRKVVRADD